MATFIKRMAIGYAFLALFLSSDTTFLLRVDSFGVNYGQVADNLPPPEKVVELLTSLKLTKERIYDTFIILTAQESFQTKQSSMLTSLDKIFSLQNAMFLESRVIKAFTVYFVSIFIIYMLTSTKQTHGTKPWLYIGLCVVFLVEISIIRFSSGDDLERQAWVITLIRTVFTVF